MQRTVPFGSFSRWRMAHASLVVLAAGLHAVQTMIGSIDKRIMIEHRSNQASKRLRSIPGIGIVGASAIVATVDFFFFF